MKLSTFGIGSVLLYFVVGSVTWVLFEGNTRPFLTPSKPQTAFAAEIIHSSNEPDYVIRGQLPPAKLIRREAQAVNPLRAEEEEPQNKTTIPPKPLTAQPLPPKTKTISQTAMQTDSSSVTPSVVSGFGEIPEPPSSPQQSILDSSGFEADPSLRQPAPHAPLEPKRLSNAPFTEQPLQSQSLQSQSLQSQSLQSQPDSFHEQRELTTGTTNSLSNADPFAAESQPVAVPLLSASTTPTASPTATPPPQRTALSQNAAANRGFAANQDFNTTTPAPVKMSAARSSQNRQEESEGTGIPGPSILEGLQTPHVTLEKTFPPEIKINEPATIKIVLRNTGRSTTKNIIVKDRVPQGTRLLSTAPEATQTDTGELFWSLGNLDANEQMSLEMRILPVREGEIGSVAVVNYSAEVSARISVTRPMLKVDVKAPAEIQLGQIANIEITISNPGSATATGIVLEEYVPDGLFHKDGKVLVNRNVDALKPKEAKKLTLPLTCTGPGNLVNRLVVKANGNLAVEEKTTIRALAPILKLGIDGAVQQFLERKSVYRLIVANQGSAAAHNVDLIATLPAAVKFVSTNQSGVYEPQTHSVHWALEELPAQEAGEIELVLLPSQTGDHSIRFKGIGQSNLKAEETKSMVIDGLPAISFEVIGESNLVEVGKETVYEVRVTNKGTKAAGNVKVRANLSDGITYARADGPVRHQTSGNIIAFDSLTQLEAKGEKIYKIAAKCLADGDHRISVQVVSDDLSSPITKEESTRVYR
jgi:uncharacterized repeat protein (TIGR01451 family)